MLYPHCGFPFPQCDPMSHVFTFVQKSNPPLSGLFPQLWLSWHCHSIPSFMQPCFSPWLICFIVKPLVARKCVDGQHRWPVPYYWLWYPLIYSSYSVVFGCFPTYGEVPYKVLWKIHPIPGREAHIYLVHMGGLNQISLRCISLSARYLTRWCHKFSSSWTYAIKITLLESADFSAGWILLNTPSSH